MIFFTADTHFCHSNIIDSCQRPFYNIKEMNERIIKNWNISVTNDDEIYILGDFLYKGNGIQANNILSRLNGIKYLIKGNHDKYLEEESFNQNYFEWVKDYYILEYQEMEFVLSHYPILEWDINQIKNKVHLYGHIHNNILDSEQQSKLKIFGKKAINVGVDVNNYCPISIEKIISLIKA